MAYKVIKGSLVVGGALIEAGSTFDHSDIRPAVMDELIRDRKVEEVTERVAPKPFSKGPTTIGKWNLDPATLSDKSIEQLNAMVLERDPKVKPFDTPEEAMAFLSSDFIPFSK